MRIRIAGNPAAAMKIEHDRQTIAPPLGPDDANPHRASWTNGKDRILDVDPKLADRTRLQRKERPSGVGRSTGQKETLFCGRRRLNEALRQRFETRCCDRTVLTLLGHRKFSLGLGRTARSSPRRGPGASETL